MQPMTTVETVKRTTPTEIRIGLAVAVALGNELGEPLRQGAFDASEIRRKAGDRVQSIALDEAPQLASSDPRMKRRLVQVRGISEESALALAG